jgi:alkylation response protein AidB-like acyl-CoA dehydrogenase
MADRFCADNYGHAQRMAMLADDPAGLPRHWRAFGELGWLAAPVPEKAGGLGSSAADLSPLLQTLGAALALEPYATAICQTAPLLVDILPEEASREALAPMIEGQAVSVVADGATEGRITARRVTGGWVLSGAMPVVPGAAAADIVWIAARTEQGPIIVRASADRAAVARFRMIDGQAAASIAVDGMVAPDEDAYTQVSLALEAANDRAAFARIAEASGVIDALYGATLAYVKERSQFGRPIGAFQVIQHRMADMFMIREETLSLAQLAAEALTGAGPDARRLLAAAELKVFDAGRAVLRDAIQLHGGMGVSDAMRVGHLAKRFLALQQQRRPRREALAAFRGAP